MIKAIYFCDKCKKEIKGDIFDIAVGRYNHNVTSVDKWNGNGFHLCSDCVNSEFEDIIAERNEDERIKTYTFIGKPIPQKTIEDIANGSFAAAGAPSTFTIKFNNNKGPENFIFKEIDNFDLPEGESEEAPCNCCAKENTTTDLSAALQKLNNSVSQFCNEMPDSIKEKAKQEQIDNSIAKKFISGVSNIPLHELIMGGSTLDERIDKIIEGLAPEEKERIKKINSEKELINFFENILEDALGVTH